MLLLFVIQIIHYSNPFCFLPIHRHGCPHLRATSFLCRHFSVWEPELEAFPDFDASTLTVAWRSNSASPSPLEWRNWRTKRSDFWCVNLSGLARPKKNQKDIHQGSELRTSPVFKWSKVDRSLNGLLFKPWPERPWTARYCKISYSNGSVIWMSSIRIYTVILNARYSFFSPI